jgi:hypothetical protein
MSCFVRSPLFVVILGLQHKILIKYLPCGCVMLVLPISTSPTIPFLKSSLFVKLGEKKQKRKEKKGTTYIVSPPFSIPKEVLRMSN